MLQILLIVFAVLMTSPGYAADIYADQTLTLDCPGGDYNKSVRDCSGTDGKAYNTIAEAVAQLAAGDTLYMRGGTWTERINLQDAGKTGTAAAWITVAGYPGETVTIRYTDPVVNSYGAVKARGNRGYFIFQDFIIDAVNHADDTGWSMRDGNHHFTLKNIEIKNQSVSGLYIEADDILLDGIYVHDSPSTCADGDRSYGVYIHHGSRIVIRNSRIWNQPGGGIQAYPGPISNLTISGNKIHENTWCSTSNVGGIVASAVSGSISGLSIFDNLIFGQTPGGVGGWGGGIWLQRTAPHTLDASLIHNNTIYNNQTGTAGPAYGVNIGAGVTNSSVANNLVLGNETGQILNAGTGTILATNKTTGTITDCTISTSDFRLKQGTNPCRNAGTAVSTRPAPVGVPDIGAYEQGEIVSATMVGAYLELVTSVMTPGVVPVSAISGITLACGGGSPCTGSPAVASANIKPGSDNVIQVAISGVSSAGTGAVSLGATNATDSLMIGGPSGLAQGINSVSALSVVGNLANSSGVAPPTGLWSRFPLTEGSGTVANDSSGNGNHGAVSSGVTWVDDASGTGVTIPTDATYRHVSSTYGNGVNPSTQDFSMCVLVRPSLTGNEQKVVLSASGNGTNQRWYAGWDTVSGQPQWGIGVQASGFTTGSEFVVTEALTLVCMVNDSTADTATLWVNGVKGTQSGKSVKTLTSYSLVGNLRVGNDGTFTTNNGGFTVYDVMVWDIKVSDADLIALYEEVSPGGVSAGYAQTEMEWEHIYTNAALAPQAITANLDGSIDVVANGGVAIKIQYICTGGACAEMAPRLYYSTDGTNFNLPVPQTVGAAGIAAWGSNADPYFNDGVSTGCIDATGLTANDGVTNADAVAGQTFALAQDHCRTDRYPVRVGNVPGTSFWFRIKTDSGQELSSYPQVIKLNVIPVQASLGFR